MRETIVNRIVRSVLYNLRNVTKKYMGKIKQSLSLANKIVVEAKKELQKEREENLKKQAKQLLEEIQESKKTVALLERQLNNFMKEVDLN